MKQKTLIIIVIAALALIILGGDNINFGRQDYLGLQWDTGTFSVKSKCAYASNQNYEIFQNDDNWLFCIETGNNEPDCQAYGYTIDIGKTCHDAFPIITTPTGCTNPTGTSGQYICKPHSSVYGDVSQCQNGAWVITQTCPVSRVCKSSPNTDVNQVCLPIPTTTTTQGTTGTTLQTLKTCANLGGDKCAEGNTCSTGEFTAAKDTTRCCVNGGCVDAQSTTTTAGGTPTTTLPQIGCEDYEALSTIGNCEFSLSNLWKNYQIECAIGISVVIIGLAYWYANRRKRK